MSKTRLLTHVVFSTKNRSPSIPLLRKRDLYRFIHGILENNRCKTLRINGMSDHVHILLDLHPSIALAQLIKTVKQSSALWMKSSPYFNMFDGWNAGYYASSISPCEAEACINYIKKQEEHHAGKELLEELKGLAMEYQLEWDERDWS